MKEQPILFNGEMVRALLAGTKTQTRRLVKPQPLADWSPVVGRYAPTLVDKRTGDEYPGPEVFGASDESFAVKCPYGQPGDRLWVRETWKPHYDEPDLMTCIKYRADGAMIKPTRWSANEGWWVEQRENDPNWYPSIFMRRSFSRLLLEIVSVRVERVQDLTEEDALAEGIAPSYSPAGYDIVTDEGTVFITEDYIGGVPRVGDLWTGAKVKHVEHRPARILGTARSWYARLWDKINPKSQWAENPWVWVVEFRKL